MRIEVTQTSLYKPSKPSKPSEPAPTSLPTREQQIANIIDDISTAEDIGLTGLKGLTGVDLLKRLYTEYSSSHISRQLTTEEQNLIYRRIKEAACNIKKGCGIEDQSLTDFIELLPS
jgi:hypothetical protein